MELTPLTKGIKLLNATRTLREDLHRLGVVNVEGEATPEISEDTDLDDDDGSTPRERVTELISDAVEMVAAAHPEKTREKVADATADFIKEMISKGDLPSLPDDDDPDSVWDSWYVQSASTLLDAIETDLLN